MPSLHVHNAFAARLQSWPNISACPFVDLNEVTEIEHPDYIELHFPVSNETIVSAGLPAVARETGGARFIITTTAFKPGWQPRVMTWVEELRDLFRCKSFDGVETFQVSPPAFDDRNRNGTKYKVPFVALYKFDAIKG